MTPAQITPQDIAGISTAAVGITQLIKWAGVDTRHAPSVLAGLSFGVVMLWVYTPFWYAVVVAASLVMMAASGVYGFATRVKPADAPPQDPPVVPAAPPAAPPAPVQGAAV